MTRDQIETALIRAEAHGPDAEHVLPGGWNRFAVDYWFEGRQFSIDLWATDWADAEMRLDALRGNGAIIGQVMVRYDA